MGSRYRLPAWMFNPLLFYINRLVAVRAREQEVMCLEAKVQAPTQAAPLEAVQRLEAQALAEAAVVAWRQRKARRRNRKQGAVEVAAGQGGVAEVAQGAAAALGAVGAAARCGMPWARLAISLLAAAVGGGSAAPGAAPRVLLQAARAARLRAAATCMTS